MVLKIEIGAGDRLQWFRPPVLSLYPSFQALSHASFLHFKLDLSLSFALVPEKSPLYYRL